MAISHLYPTQRPALDLNFARQKRLDPRVTFTRGSTATYVGSDGLIKTAADNEARFDHDPATGESLGLLTEESRTNLVNYSDDFSQTSQWSAANSTLTAASNITAPDGSTNTYKLVENALTGSHFVGCLPSNQCIAGTTYTYSMFAKAAERTQIMLQFDAEAGSQVYFDLSSGEIVSGTIGTIKAVGNGWYHCSVTLQPANNTEPKFYTAVNGSFTTPGDGTSGIYIWGAQLETGSFPTSYIPTSGSTVTRSADVASMTGTNFSSWYNQSEGTVLFKATTLTTATKTFLYVCDASSAINERIIHETNSLSIRSSGTTIINRSISAYHPYNSAIAYKVNDFATSDRGSVQTVSSGAVPSSVDIAYFYHPIYSQVHPSGHISRLTYYPVRLPDATLQALTL